MAIAAGFLAGMKAGRQMGPPVPNPRTAGTYTEPQTPILTRSDGITFTGKCDPQSLACEMTVLGGKAFLSNGKLTFSGLDGGAVGRLLSVKLSDRISGSVIPDGQHYLVALKGGKVDAREILDQLPPGVAAITGLTAPLTEMIGAPLTVIARVYPMDDGAIIRSLTIGNEGGKVIGKEIPIKWKHSTSSKLRWLPRSDRLPKDMALALKDPDGFPSLTLNAAIAPQGTKIALDQPELERKGKIWLKAKINSIDRQSIADALKKMH